MDEKVTLSFDSEFMGKLRKLVDNTVTQSGKSVTVEEFLEIQIYHMVDNILEMIKKKQGESK